MNKKIPITDPRHLIDMGITHGLLSALEALEKIPSQDKLTGVGVAKYAIKALEAEHRVLVMQKNIRIAVKEGVDLDTHDILWAGRAEIEAEPRDLVEQAQD